MNIQFIYENTFFFFQNNNETKIFIINEPNIMKKSEYQ